MCVLHTKPIVGTGEEVYNQNLDSFHTNKIGDIARAIAINPLHVKSPRHILIVALHVIVLMRHGLRNNGVS